MRPKDLMIGDYLNTSFGIGRVVCIDANTVSFVNDKNEEFDIEYPEEENWMSGISLTPEILEKNGFKFDGSGQCSMMFLSEPRFSEELRFNIYVGLKRKTIEVFAAHPIERLPNWRKCNKVYLEVCGCYVHELQHVLRLCQIDKEIEL